MKKTVLLSLFTVLLFSIGLSQDKIVMQSGEVLYGKVEEVGVEEIKYKKQDNLSGPVYVLKKSDVHAIHYENGSKDEFAKKEEKKEDDYVKEDGKKGKGDNDDVYGGNDDTRKDPKEKRRRRYDERTRVDVVVPVWHMLGWLVLFDVLLGCF